LFGIPFSDLDGVIVSLFKLTVVCIAVLAICGCGQRQLTPSAPAFPIPASSATAAPAPASSAPASSAPASSGQATSAVPVPVFATTQKDAESGDALAQYNLGVMYRDGQGMPQNYAEAMKWFRLAADQGLADAQYELARMYNKGQGVRPDYSEAVNLYRLASAKGHADAQFALGMMYFGANVPRSQAQAARLFRVAAEKGHAKSHSMLGMMYYKGEGVPQDAALAYAWYAVASAGGDERDKMIHAQIAARLTPEQLSQGQKRATELLEKYGNGK